MDQERDQGLADGHSIARDKMSVEQRPMPDNVAPGVVSNVGTYLGRRLVQIGVREYFAVPGDYNLLLLDQLIKVPELKLISCCNELNASYGGDGYARAKGVGCVVVTFTVGGLSAINGIAGAYSDDLPVIIVSGGPNSNDFASDRVLHHTTGLIERRQQYECFKNVVAEAVEVRSPKQAARQIDHAIVTAMTLKKPVYIEIACNIAEEPVSVPIPFQLPPQKPSNTRTTEAALQVIEDMWNTAAKPVVVVGVKVRMSNAFDAVVRMADKLGCVVAIMPDAKGMFPEDHPNFIGTYWGPVSSAACCEVIESADMYIFIGPRFNDYNTVGYTCLIKKRGLIKVNPDRVETPSGEYGCVYMKEFCDALGSRLQPKDASMKMYKRIFAPEGVPNRPASHEPLSIHVVRDTVQSLLSSNTAVIAETGDSWFQGQKLKLPRGCGYEFQMQYGSIGWSVGALMGYAFALKEQGKRVVAMIGDGSFQMTAQEVSTMIRYQLNPIIFLINNRGYTIEVEIHDGIYNVIKNWDYKKLIEAFNADDGNALALRADTEEELVAAVAKAKEHTAGLSFIEVTIDKDDCSRELLEWGSRVATANGRAYVEL